MVLHGDCIEQLKQLEDNSIDSIVTDPPYELKFMNKSWDGTGIAYNVEMWKECLRVLKPGGHLLSFGGTRTYHRMACAIEDAGFEIRDQIQWIYGSGFPKSQNISKAMDKKFGVEREIIDEVDRRSKYDGASRSSNADKDGTSQCAGRDAKVKITVPATDEAQYWDGWGTALKPANEPIVLARKPLSEKTVVDNVLKWGTGVINIDESRIPYGEGGNLATNPSLRNHINGGNGGKIIANEKVRRVVTPNEIGRFPTNVLLDEENNVNIKKQGEENIDNKTSGIDVSKYFYCPKASNKERKGNTHPTVKPLKLMEYLTNLITPKGGIVLDPFAGSGSTLVAAKNKEFNYIGIEKEEEYIEIIEKRLG